MSIKTFIYFIRNKVYQPVIKRPIKYLIDKTKILHARLKGKELQNKEISPNNLYWQFTVWLFESVLFPGLCIAIALWSLFDCPFNPIAYGLLWWLGMIVIDKIAKIQ